MDRVYMMVVGLEVLMMTEFKSILKACTSTVVPIVKPACSSL